MSMVPQGRWLESGRVDPFCFDEAQMRLFLLNQRTLRSVFYRETLVNRCIKPF
ncbi:hypothetical protein CPB86DRAFT_346551 [Serendipita vermifera]|nr:hypothetical protein CPB86DRAFT_346551 [Serendipita vermifera]